MKKSLFYLSLAAFAAIGFTSCSDDDEPGDKTPEEVPQVSLGAYILNQGEYHNLIEGELCVIDYATSKMAREVFDKANGRSMGATPQCGVAYGSKIYLGMYQSNTIEIIDAKTYKSLKQIKLSETGFPGTLPRSMVTKGGKVYISMYDGYVSRLDTLSMVIDRSVKVGPNPELIGIHGNNLYVPNSDGMNYQIAYGTTASVVSLDSFTETSTFTVPMNPYQFISAGGELFLLCKGNYNDVENALYKVEADNTCTKIANATFGSVKDDTIYYIDAPYGGTSSYAKYDVKTGKITPLTFEEVPVPNSIGVDPITGTIIIGSYKDTGSEAYSLPETVYQYDSNGKFVKKYDCGIGAPCIFFNTK